MLRRTLWRIKFKWPNLGRWLLVMVGLTVGAATGWWFTLKDWQRNELLFRAEWQISQWFSGWKAEPRPYRYFATCEDARAAGYENIGRDEPSYRPELDADGDGVACEPWHGSRRWWRRWL
jgi:hypothetical protein